MNFFKFHSPLSGVNLQPYMLYTMDDSEETNVGLQVRIITNMFIKAV